MAKEKSVTVSIGGWIGQFGWMIAGAMSYAHWHRFWLAVGHALLGWFYVIYSIFQYGFPHIPK